MSVVIVTAGLLERIDTHLAAHKPERGGALLAAGEIVHFLVEDPDGVYSSVSWDISAQLTPAVQAEESHGRGRLVGTVHTHPESTLDPSSQDFRATARLLDENPHLERSLICIVTLGEPRLSDLSIGKRHRMSTWIARRAPGGECRAARVSARVVPIDVDLRAVGLSPSGIAITLGGVPLLGYPLEGADEPTLLVCPPTYPMSAPMIVTVTAGGELEVRDGVRWDPTRPRPNQLEAVLRTALRRAPSGMGARIESLAGSLCERVVLVVGLGSVGSDIVEILARNGVGNFILIDPDVVEGANVSRQRITHHDLGEPKVVATERLVHSINPAAKVEVLQADVKNIDDLAARCEAADLIIAATDDPLGQAWLSHCAYYAGTPLIACALYRAAAAGEIVIVHPGVGTPCWHCSIGGGAAEGSEKDYGTGRLKGEIAIGPRIHQVSTAAGALAVSMLAGPERPAGRDIATLLARGTTVGFVATTPDWEFVARALADADGHRPGHQFAPQSLWARPSARDDCPVCGLRVAPTDPTTYGKSIRRALDRAAAVARAAEGAADSPAAPPVPTKQPATQRRHARRPRRRRVAIAALAVVVGGVGTGAGLSLDRWIRAKSALAAVQSRRASVSRRTKTIARERPRSEARLKELTALARPEVVAAVHEVNVEATSLSCLLAASGRTPAEAAKDAVERVTTDAPQRYPVLNGREWGGLVDGDGVLAGAKFCSQEPSHGA